MPVIYIIFNLTLGTKSVSNLVVNWDYSTECVRTLATQKKLAYLGFQCLDHPPYSPDLAPSDHHLFPGLRKQLKGRHFSSDAGVIAAAET